MFGNVDIVVRSPTTYVMGRYIFAMPVTTVTHNESGKNKKSWMRFLVWESLLVHIPCLKGLNVITMVQNLIVSKSIIALAVNHLPMPLHFPNTHTVPTI
mmetsp:Transcript_2801/g.4006  ORF Transcript_2801/g.4006 Transcript_2801/m.4006 type:complete len:99 (+) Transcript_2801:508-804(+)